MRSEETILDAAFRQGQNLVTAAGRDSARRARLPARGRGELERYSWFALGDSERANGYALMCRAMPECDLVVELLHYDADDYRLDTRSSRDAT